MFVALLRILPTISVAFCWDQAVAGQSSDELGRQTQLGTHSSLEPFCEEEKYRVELLQRDFFVHKVGADLHDPRIELLQTQADIDQTSFSSGGDGKMYHVGHEEGRYNPLKPELAQVGDAKQQQIEARFRRGFVSDLAKDDLFTMKWSPAGSPGSSPPPAHVASENCDSFVAKGMDPAQYSCYIESPEHTLARKWIPANATVLEFGARFGTTTCELAKILKNSGRLVTIEPDEAVWGFLESNVKSHNCLAHVLRGAISSSPLRMLKSGYGGRSDVSNLRGGMTVPTFTWDEVEKASGLKFDTLLIDCEGCAQDMMDQIGPKIQSQIKTIVIEADMPLRNTPETQTSDCKKHCMDYVKFFSFLKTSGFEQVDEFNDCDTKRSGAPQGTWCGPWINHHAFRRK